MYNINEKIEQQKQELERLGGIESSENLSIEQLFKKFDILIFLQKVYGVYFGNYAEALKYCDASIDITNQILTEREKNPSKYAKWQDKIDKLAVKTEWHKGSKLYFLCSLGRPEEAIEYYENNIKLGEQDEDVREIYEALNVIPLIYATGELGDTEAQANYLEKVKQLMIEKNDIEDLIVSCVDFFEVMRAGNVGNTGEILQIFKDIKGENNSTYHYWNGKILKSQGNLEEAIKEYEIAYDMLGNYKIGSLDQGVNESITVQLISDLIEAYKEREKLTGEKADIGKIRILYMDKIITTIDRTGIMPSYDLLKEISEKIKSEQGLNETIGYFEKLKSNIDKLLNANSKNKKSSNKMFQSVSRILGELHYEKSKTLTDKSRISELKVARSLIETNKVKQGNIDYETIATIIDIIYELSELDSNNRDNYIKDIKKYNDMIIKDFMAGNVSKEDFLKCSRVELGFNINNIIKSENGELKSVDNEKTSLIIAILINNHVLSDTKIDEYYKSGLITEADIIKYAREGILSEDVICQLFMNLKITQSNFRTLIDEGIISEAKGNKAIASIELDKIREVLKQGLGLSISNDPYVLPTRPKGGGNNPLIPPTPGPHKDKWTISPLERLTYFKLLGFNLYMPKDKRIPTNTPFKEYEFYCQTEPDGDEGVTTPTPKSLVIGEQFYDIAIDPLQTNNGLYNDGNYDESDPNGSFPRHSIGNALYICTLQDLAVIMQKNKREIITIMKTAGNNSTVLAINPMERVNHPVIEAGQSKKRPRLAENLYKKLVEIEKLLGTNATVHNVFRNKDTRATFEEQRDRIDDGSYDTAIRV